jgi:hypothetical protein
MDALLLAQLLIAADLVAATTMYSMMIRRRAQRRRLDADRRAVEDSGLQGLVRVFLADSRS